jgi:hypothetical protein
MPAVALRVKIFPMLVLASCAAAAALGATSSSQKGIAYRWVDEHGELHYGDHIPPQYANQERAVLNAQGVEVGHIEAAKSAEQQAVEARTRAALMRQKQHDSFLVTTYTSVKDIEALRDVRLDQLKGQRAAAEQYVETLRTRLTGLQSRAQGFQPYNDRADARRMPDDLAENLVRTVNEMRVQTNALAQTQQDEAELRAQFQADIERYRELHTIHQ